MNPALPVTRMVVIGNLPCWLPTPSQHTPLRGSRAPFFFGWVHGLGTGCPYRKAELSLFTIGFLPGETSRDRLNALLNRRGQVRELVLKLRVRVNDFLGRAVARVREVFGGKATDA